MHGVRSFLNWIVQINFGLKPKFGLKLLKLNFKPNFVVTLSFGLTLVLNRTSVLTLV